MLRSILSVVALALVSSINGEFLVADNFGNSVSLPFAGGHVQNALTMESSTSVSPYVLQVFVNDANRPGEDESFYFDSLGYGQATLLSQTHSRTFAQADAVEGNFVGTKQSPTTETGLYTFTFDIPVGQKLDLDIMYFDHNPVAPLTDRIHIAVKNQKEA